MYSNKINKIIYGGDYNPEQWPEEIWAEDMRLLKEAHIDTVTLNVFSWAALQPSEEEYDFEKLDKIMDMVRDNGLRVILATSTGAHPAWMARKYPEILRTEFNGMKRKFGGRHNSCPNSSVYRKYSVRLAEKLAERYQEYDNIVAWHISNEYGGECYCENCEKAFRVWLRKKYGTLEEVNRVWNTAFWGHTFYDWDDIVLPNLLSEHFEYDRSQFQGITLDYKRFNSESILECYRMEYEAVKKITPGIPVTTNLMGFYKGLDYKMWAKYMDVVSWDNYPANEDSPAMIAMSHDLMRGINDGKPFLLMEQTPSVTNWLPYNALKRPGVMRLWSAQAVAHGADAVMFFQMRRTIGACEKLHGAVIDHVGNNQTRVYREVQALGSDLEKIGSETLGAVTEAETALYFDWDNWWAMECSAGPSCELKYKDELYRYYEALHRMNIPVDIVGPEDNLDRYKLLIAPVLYMVKEGYDEKIRSFVENGGTFVTTFFSGIVDEHDLVILGGYPGKLRDIVGLWVEEEDALPTGMENHFHYKGERYPAKLLCDLSHPEGEKLTVLSRYEEDFYAGMPVVTKNNFGRGYAYYVATRSDERFYREFLKDICVEIGIKGVIPEQEGIEATMRHNKNGNFLFLLNHGEKEVQVRLEKGGLELISKANFKAGEMIRINAKDIKIIKFQEV